MFLSYFALCRFIYMFLFTWILLTLIKITICKVKQGSKVTKSTDIHKSVSLLYCEVRKRPQAEFLMLMVTGQSFRSLWGWRAPWWLDANRTVSVNHFLSSEDWKQESSDDRPAASTTHLKLKQSSAAQTADTMLTCSTESRRPSSRVHPVPLHPLHQSHRRHRHLVVLLPEFQHLGETGDVQARVCRQKSVCEHLFL